MRINNYHPPKSSFLSINKDMRLIVDKILNNDRLCKLLYYTSRDALEKPKLTDEQKLSLFGKNIKIIPKLYVDNEVLNYMIISFDDHVPTSNPQFRNSRIEFDILCHFDQWQMKDFDLRPYRIAAELDSMFSDAKLTGIGKTEFYGATEIIQNDEFAGICLLFNVYHGEEDKKMMPNPADQEEFEQEYKEMIQAQKEAEKDYPNGLQGSLIDGD